MSQVLSPGQVPQLATSWLDRTPGTAKSIWIYTDNDRVGIEIVHRIKRAFAGDFASYEIPYDTLPGRVVHAVTKNEVYVLSQPNHLNPVMTSMHGFTQAEVDRSTGRIDDLLSIVPGELALEMARARQGGGHADGRGGLVDRLPNLPAGAGRERLDPTDFVKTTINPETQEAEYLRKPSLIVVDAERPWWEQLLPFVGKSSQVIETDRVPADRRLRSMMARKSEALRGL